MRQSSPFIFSLVLFSASLFAAPPSWDELDDPDLDPQRRSEIIRAQEQKWGVEEDLPSINAQKSPARRLLELLKTETLTFSPGYSRQLRMGHITLEIPAGAFQGSPVEARVTVLKTPADFALAGIPLEFLEAGKPVVLESDGMFHLEFIQDGKSIEPSSPIAVRMTPGNEKEMNMYRLEGKTWTEVGSTGMATDWPEGCDVRRNPGNPLLVLVESPYCGGEYTSVRIYRNISRSGWWNFDKPADNITCLTGIFRSPGEGFNITVQSVGLDYLGLSHARRTGNRFAINVAANQSVKIYSVVTDRDSRRVYIGSLAPIKTPNNTAFVDFESDDYSKCTDVGELKVKRSSVGLLSNRAAFLKAIGIPEGGL